jgi:tetratricopeptide (TPR) repeat protein
MIRENKSVEARKMITRYTGVKNGWYYLADAEAYEAANKDNLAAVSYSKALKMMPDVSEALAGNGRMCLVKKKYSDAIMLFGQAMGSDPDNMQLMLDMGKAYDGAKENANATAMYEEVIRRQPDSPDAYYLLARNLSKNKDHSKSIQILKEGLRNNKNSYSLLIVLGHEYRALKMYNDAVDSYLRAVKIDEAKCLDAYKYVGTIYYSQKDEKKAKKYYEMYITAGGKDPKVTQLLKRLP